MTLLSLPFVTFVGIAGAVGAVFRYLLGRFVAERVGSQFPLGTLLINLTGAFFIGLLSALAGHKIISTSQQVILATGFLGGYTTFSTMSWEGVQLVRGGSTTIGLLYLERKFSTWPCVCHVGLVVGGWVL